MIQVKNVSKVFNNGIGKVKVLNNINFSVEKGGFVSIIGPSGCGKTTLLRIIGSLADPCEGKVLIDGKTTQEECSEQRFGFVFQDPALLPWRSVLANIGLPGEVLHEKEIIKRSLDMVKLVGLEGFERALPKHLSGGMKTRVAIARSLSFCPSILLMDEPFGNLDEITRDMMNFELLRIQEEMRTTVIFVTHSISEAVLLSDKVIVLTPRPGEIKKIVPIDLPKPRHRGTRRMAQSMEYVENLRDVLLS